MYRYCTLTLKVDCVALATPNKELLNYWSKELKFLSKALWGKIEELDTMGVLHDLNRRATAGQTSRILTCIIYYKIALENPDLLDKFEDAISDFVFNDVVQDFLNLTSLDDLDRTMCQNFTVRDKLFIKSRELAYRIILVQHLRCLLIILVSISYLFIFRVHLDP